ncbi:MAG: mechanosensitive ion channel family protein [Sandaracinus sp.]
MHGFLNRNAPDDLVAAALVALAVLLGSAALRRYALKGLAALAAKTPTIIDDLVVHFFESIRGWGWVAIALLSGVLLLDWTPTQERALHHAFVVAFAVQLGLSLQAVLMLGVERTRQREGRPGTATTAAAVGAVGRLLVWSAIVLVGLSNLGVEVSALAATLGVGGLAAAFAVQNVLGDLFAALSIYFDRPFDIGDSIQVDTFGGLVEEISWRSTRVRSTSGEQIVFANSDLTRARILNFRRLNERRVLLTFRLPLDTKVEKLEAMPGRVRGLVEGLKDVRFERAHLVDVSDGGYQLDLVFWCTSPEYERMLDRKQSVILGVRRILDEQGLTHAIPRTLVERGAAT